jgi:adenosine deaminase
MLHVLPPTERPLVERLNSQNFLEPLPCEICPQPVLVGTAQRSELVDLEPALTPDLYPIDPGTFTSPAGDWLWKALDHREKEGNRLLVNFHSSLAEHEHHENWRSLYRLSPAHIQILRKTLLSESDREWLIQMPKAELHCHLGGLLDLSEQIEVGHALWETLDPAEQSEGIRLAEDFVRQNDVPGGNRWKTVPPEKRAFGAAALLTGRDPDFLQALLWPADMARVALKDNHPWGFQAYEHPGALVGSTILQHPVATRACARKIKDRCERDGLSYLEVRCSPSKYHADFLEVLHTALSEDPRPSDPDIRLLLIADRRRLETLEKTVRLALGHRRSLGGFIAGIDLAGDESEGDPAQLAPLFHDAFAVCLPVTIHAGEGQPAANIWKSAYHLHADRIGHGLTLAADPELARRFRDRRICLELCPTSNREVVGYHDPAYPGSNREYPLRTLIQLGVPLTLCTDNPGISRTTLADEYLAAARMTPGGISLWETLALIKQGFSHAFLSADRREELIKRADRRVADLAREIAETKLNRDS